jgi:hypothetical protein
VTESVAERSIWSQDDFRAMMEACRPAVLRGFVAHWPAVAAASRSPAVFCDYLKRFDTGGTMDALVGPPHIAGKYYYGEDFKGFNFERRPMTFAAALDAIVAGLDQPDSPSIYAGSIPIDKQIPGFMRENQMPWLPSVLPRIWVGHASNISSHYDAMENIACVVAGRRRFTLYAPELIGRLYIGPIDKTMAGQPVSLAASSPPDDAKYPLFKDIRDRALVAELEPGDAIFLPKLWWHQVEGLSAFNTLVNYWFDAFAIGPDLPYTAMLLAMITIAERPPAERQAWKAWFDHFVFRSNGHPLAHLPPDLHGVLGPLKPDNYGGIRAYIMHKLRDI